MPPASLAWPTHKNQLQTMPPPSLQNHLRPLTYQLPIVWHRSESIHFQNFVFATLEKVREWMNGQTNRQHRTGVAAGCQRGRMLPTGCKLPAWPHAGIKLTNQMTTSATSNIAVSACVHSNTQTTMHNWPAYFSLDLVSHIIVPLSQYHADMTKPARNHRAASTGIQ